jgi:periplasmic divalent cation tolerance protein
MSGVVVALVSFPDGETAQQIARILVQEHLAACVNILPGARSIYHWKGEVVEENESVALFKTSTIHRGKFQQRLLELHPAEVPECLFLDVLDGSTEYLNWLRSEVLLGNWRKPLEE